MLQLSTVKDPRSLRDAFASFPSGVTALCALRDGEPVGLAASSFTSVSLSPPLISVCIQSDSQTWPLLMQAQRIGVSTLGEDQDGTCRRLASRTGDRFADVDWRATESGAVLIEGAAAMFECSVSEIIPAGDHHIVLLLIEALTRAAEVEPLVFHASRFRRLQPLGAGEA